MPVMRTSENPSQDIFALFAGLVQQHPSCRVALRHHWPGPHCHASLRRHQRDDKRDNDEADEAEVGRPRDMPPASSSHTPLPCFHAMATTDRSTSSFLASTVPMGHVHRRRGRPNVNVIVRCGKIGAHYRGGCSSNLPAPLTPPVRQAPPSASNTSITPLPWSSLNSTRHGPIALPEKISLSPNASLRVGTPLRARFTPDSCTPRSVFALSSSGTFFSPTLGGELALPPSLGTRGNGQEEERLRVSLRRTAPPPYWMTITSHPFRPTQTNGGEESEAQPCCVPLPSLAGRWGGSHRGQGMDTPLPRQGRTRAFVFCRYEREMTRHAGEAFLSTPNPPSIPAAFEGDGFHDDQMALEELSITTTSSCVFGCGLEGVEWEAAIMKGDVDALPPRLVTQLPLLPLLSANATARAAAVHGVEAFLYNIKEGEKRRNAELLRTHIMSPHVMDAMGFEEQMATAAISARPAANKALPHAWEILAAPVETPARVGNLLKETHHNSTSKDHPRDDYAPLFWQKGTSHAVGFPQSTSAVSAHEWTEQQQLRAQRKAIAIMEWIKSVENTNIGSV